VPNRGRADVGLQKAGGLEVARRLACLDSDASARCASIRTKVRGGIEVVVHRRVLLRSEQRHRLGIVGSKLRERFRLFYRTLEPRVGEVIRLRESVLRSK